MSAIAELRARIRALERVSACAGKPSEEVASFGLPELDHALPWGGLPRGGLHEVAGAEQDGAAFGFAAALLGRTHGMVLWCRPARQEAGVPYGPGLAEFGLTPDRLILVETT